MALAKYARLGDVLCEKRHANGDVSRRALVSVLAQWTDSMSLPRLNQYGVNHDALDKIVANARGSSMKTNPIVLSNDEIKRILLMRL